MAVAMEFSQVDSKDWIEFIIENYLVNDENLEESITIDRKNHLDSNDYLFDIHTDYSTHSVRNNIFGIFLWRWSYFRHSIHLDDDLLTVRHILHINMCICFLIAQFLFFFSIDQVKSKVSAKKQLNHVQWMFSSSSSVE